ncbi:MAG: hypothetical protein DID91_2727703965 [Candidatus Nitrotoga sp. MKT]|nr:MAG: hypothetical protein DID91_2727703965 [Candidatus Nitrotoga sp. MKT]
MLACMISPLEMILRTGELHRLFMYFLKLLFHFWLYALRATLTHARRQHSLSPKQNRLMCMQALWSKIFPIKILTYS